MDIIEEDKYVKLYTIERPPAPPPTQEYIQNIYNVNIKKTKDAMTYISLNEIWMYKLKTYTDQEAWRTVITMLETMYNQRTTNDTFRYFAIEPVSYVKPVIKTYTVFGIKTKYIGSESFTYKSPNYGIKVYESYQLNDGKTGDHEISSSTSTNTIISGYIENKRLLWKNNMYLNNLKPLKSIGVIGIKYIDATQPILIKVGAGFTNEQGTLKLFYNHIQLNFV